MTLGERLKSAREYCELTQTEVSKRTGINFKTISNWEHNVSRPSTDDLVVLSEIYNTSSDSLLGIPPRTVSVLPKNSLILEAYNNAPKEIQAIIDTALQPYLHKKKEAKGLA